MPREPMSPDEKFKRITENVECTLAKHIDKVRQKIRLIDFNQDNLETDEDYWNECRDRIERYKEEEAAARKGYKNSFDRYALMLCQQLLKMGFASTKDSLLRSIKDGRLLRDFKRARQEDLFIFREVKKEPSFNSCYLFLSSLNRSNFHMNLLKRTDEYEDMLELAFNNRVERVVDSLMEDLLNTVERRSALASLNNRDESVLADEELDVETVRSGEEELMADPVVETDIVEAVVILEEEAARMEVEVQQEENHSSEGHGNLENIDEDLVKVEELAEKLKKDYEEVKEFNKKPEHIQLFRRSIDQFANDTENVLNSIWVLKDLIENNATMERTSKSDSLNRLDMVREQLRNSINSASQQLQSSQGRLMNILVHHMRGITGLNKEDKVQIINDFTIGTLLQKFLKNEQIATSPKEELLMTWFQKMRKNPQFQIFQKDYNHWKDLLPLDAMLSSKTESMDTLRKDMRRHLQKGRNNKRANGEPGIGEDPPRKKNNN
ncbi:unnamed protein product [Caenorhabditis brenneri]